MKNLIFALFLLLMLSSCGRTQDAKWTSLTYDYSEGPLPPPYHHEYSISINSDRSANMTYKLGYNADDPSYNYSFTLDEGSMNLLNEKVVESRILEGSTEAVPENEHPVGGSLNRVTVYVVNPDPNLDQPPLVFQAPYFPKKEYSKGLNELYECINGLVPQDVKTDIEKRRTDFENKAKQ